MDLTAFAEALRSSAISEWMRGSLAALPVIESIHLMAVATVYGTILIVDLRLMGITDTNRPFTRVFREILRWTWLAFGVAAVTGVLLVKITSGARRTRSAARLGNKLALSAQRYSIRRLLPSTHPSSRSPCSKAATRN